MNAARKALAVPIVDKINWNTLEHSQVYPENSRYKGIFEWGFLYKEMQLPPFYQGNNDQERFSKPYWYVFNLFFSNSRLCVSLSRLRLSFKYFRLIFFMRFLVVIKMIN